MDYTIELDIAAPRERVVELFVDDRNLPCWQPGFVSIEKISGETDEVGSKWKLLYLNRGKEVEMIETILAHDSPREFSAVFEADGMRMTVRNLFEEVGQDQTKWTSENEAEVSGFFMRLIVFLMPGCFRKQSLLYMENFRNFVETGADIREG